MKSISKWVIARLLEPSTWAGLGVAALAIQHLLQGNPTDLATIIAGGFSALAAVISEKS